MRHHIALHCQHIVGADVFQSPHLRSACNGYSRRANTVSATLLVAGYAGSDTAEETTPPVRPEDMF